ncbi:MULTISPECIES: hypothetical protein [unclassified Bradyrhizobium]|uniref:hypothetical protein n=1 Tax=unclassified Bradyrhizobium TaxID=2631580 RepID=UPI001FEF8EBE|nr:MULTISPECIES: hypothetical protein [unclassified Bradyrhizobium]MDN4983839.1 hypothetical protein [Bradyrhizobium sp. WYCCWR 13022]
MNDNANTPGSALVGDVQAELPEHFDWSALALPRSKPIPVSPTSAASASLEVDSASGGDRVSSQTTPPVDEPDREPSAGPISLPGDPTSVAASALDPMPEAARGEEPSVLSSPPAAKTPPVISLEPLAVVKARHPPLPLPKDRILRLRFSDVGEPSEPGEHRSRFGLVEITRNDLAVWKAFPNAVFTVIQPSPYSNAMISRLGTFEV